MALLIAVFTCLFVATLQAQTPSQQITYQGKLVENGIPFSGSVTMVFELINPTTNAIEWTETQTVNVEDGLYSVVLGTDAPFAPNFFVNNPTLGLRVSVNGNTLTPLTVLRAVPYAHAARSVANNSITSIKIDNGTIQTIDIASGGQNKILGTNANGDVVWIDRSAASVPTGTAGGDLTGTFPNPTIANDVIDSTNIVNGSINGNDIADGTINRLDLEDNAVTEPKIADNAITSNKIINGSIKAEDMEAGGVNEVLSTNASNIVEWQPISSLETDPKVGTLSDGSVPRWDNTNQELINGSITDDGSDVEVNPSADFSVNAGGEVSLSSSGNVSINSTTTTISQNLSIGDSLILNSHSVNNIATSIGSPTSNLNLVTEAAVENYVATQLSGAALSSGNGITISPSPSNQINLGGALTGPTTIDLNNQNFVFSTASGSPSNLSIINAPFSVTDGANASFFTSTNSGTYTTNSYLTNLVGSKFDIRNQATNTSIFQIIKTTSERIDSDLVLGQTTENTGGTINIVAQTTTSGSDFYKGASLNLQGGETSNTKGGDLYLKGGGFAASTGTIGTVFLQDNGGNVEIGDDVNLDSKLLLNGWLNLPDISTIPIGSNNLYAQTGNLFWNGSQIVTSSTLTDGNGTTAAGNHINLGGTFGSDIDLIGNGTSLFNLDLGTATDFNGSSITLKAADAGETFSGPSLQGGNVNITAGNEISGNGNGIGGNVNITAGTGDSGDGGIFLSGDTDISGTTTLGSDLSVQGNTTIGSFTNNRPIFLNGRLNLSNISAPTGTNNLYANGGDLFWDGQNISAGATNPWLFQGSNIYYDLGNVGIGNFTSALPNADLHIRSLGTEAEMRIATLVGAANLNDASKIVLRTARRSVTDNEQDIADNQLLGKIIFEGYNGSFQEGAKIETRLLNFANSKNELSFHVDGNKKMNIADNAMQITLVPQAEFIIEDDEATPNELLFLGRDAVGVNEFEVQLASVDIGSSSFGGSIELKAQDITDGVNIYEGAKLDLQGADADGSLRGGDVFLDAGAGDGNQGTVFLQFFNEGNVEIGRGESELQVNGLINMPNFGGVTPISGNFLYADGGNLFWGNQDLSGGASLWQELGGDVIRQSKVGIGDFSTVADADLHIKREGTGLPANIKLSSANGSAGSPAGLAITDKIGEVVFNGYNGSTFQDVGRIEMVTTAISPSLEAEMSFYTNGVENMRIRSNGLVNMGTTTGTAKLNVQNNGDVLSLVGTNTASTINTLEASSVGQSRAAFFSRTGTGNISPQPIVLINEGNNDSSAPTLRINGGNTSTAALSVNSRSTIGTQRILTLQNSGVDRFFVENNGDVDIAGDLNVAGTTTNSPFSSDMRYKTQISTLNNSLQNILSLRGTQYFWKNKEKRGNRLQFGVIAQEVEEVFPNLVRTDSEGFKSVHYIDLIPVLIEATKEQQTIIENQKEEIQTQKSEIEMLKKQLSELKTLVASLEENQNANSTLAKKVEQLEKQLTALVDSLSKKTETNVQTASLKEDE
ncbi:tail fiber domain-containing protein [Bernardetia sp.]|uniref:tail fiber domain-containing protein n=1 Tax=Bernardetia sp. TaxID=1937974 RepID=UPI0025B99318|nr:tail fiber domain-containing protein [Bernardetia sp.]